MLCAWWMCDARHCIDIAGSAILFSLFTIREGSVNVARILKQYKVNAHSLVFTINIEMLIECARPPYYLTLAI